MKDETGDEAGAKEELVGLRLHIDRLKDERSELQDEIIELRRQLRKAEEKELESDRLKARFEKIMAIAYELNSPIQQLLSTTELEGNPRYRLQIEALARTVRRVRELEGLETVAAATKAEAETEAGLERCDTHRVLIVDDEQPIRDLFGKIIRESLPDIQIDFAADGQKGLEAFVKAHPSVVVMDIAMPVMNGEVAFIEIQRSCRDRGWKMPAVIFCTGFAPPESIRNLRMSEGHCYLPKPVTSATLVQAVRERLVWKPQ